MDVIKELQEWQLNQCNGKWEHSFGIKINTLDNPGWIIDIDLVGTKNAGSEFEKINLERSENDWIHCQVENKVFKSACGPSNLGEILEIFLKWTKN